MMLCWICRAAATEIGVLQDVLAIAREKRYLVLDPINNEMLDQRSLPVLLMLARKKVFFYYTCCCQLCVTKHTISTCFCVHFYLPYYWKLSYIQEPSCC